MTSKDIENQLITLREQLTEAETAKANAGTRMEFDEAADWVGALRRDVEFSELTLAKARSAEEQALRSAKLASLRKLIDSTTPAAQTEAFGPIVARVVSAYDSLLAEFAALNQIIQAKVVEVEAAAADASALAVSMPRPPRPEAQAAALMARALLGKARLRHSIQVCDSEPELLDLVTKLLDMSPFPQPGQRYKDDPPGELYPISSQIEDLLAGTFAARKSEILKVRQERSDSLVKAAEARERAEAERRERQKNGIEFDYGQADDPLDLPAAAVN
jgi:hypothetical protein